MTTFQGDFGEFVWIAPLWAITTACILREFLLIVITIEWLNNQRSCCLHLLHRWSISVCWKCHAFCFLVYWFLLRDLPNTCEFLDFRQSLDIQYSFNLFGQLFVYIRYFTQQCHGGSRSGFEFSSECCTLILFGRSSLMLTPIEINSITE